MMGFFSKNKFDINTVVSVVILEQTQLYRKQTKSGLVFGNDILSPDVVCMDGGAEPAGMVYTFSVTYKDGRKEIIKENSGTAKCDLLLQKALDGNNYVSPEISAPVSETNNTSDQKGQEALDIARAPELKKNQLPQGVYEIGKDVPSGTYDFHWVWGNGKLDVYKAKETILGNLTFGQWVGNTQPYEKLDCIHVECKEGFFLHVTGNLIVDIVKSKEIQLDL